MGPQLNSEGDRYEELLGSEPVDPNPCPSVAHTGLEEALVESVEPRRLRE